MKKNYTTHILIFSIFVTIVTICLFVFFLKVIENKNQHTFIVHTTLQEKMKEKEEATIFAEKVTEIKVLQDSINSYFVDPDKIDTFVNYLEEIGLGLGSQLLVKDIEIPQKIKKTIIFNLLITGTFEEVMKTITLLENIPYRINITKIYLNKEMEQQTQETNVKNKINMESTWQADVSFNILSLD